MQIYFLNSDTGMCFQLDDKTDMDVQMGADNNPTPDSVKLDHNTKPTVDFLQAAAARFYNDYGETRSKDMVHIYKAKERE